MLEFEVFHLDFSIGPFMIEDLEYINWRSDIFIIFGEFDEEIWEFFILNSLWLFYS